MRKLSSSSGEGEVDDMRLLSTADASLEKQYVIKSRHGVVAACAKYGLGDLSCGVHEGVFASPTPEVLLATTVARNETREYLFVVFIKLC